LTIAWSNAARVCTCFSVKIVFSYNSTLIKNKIKFSSYIRKFRSGAVAKSYMRKGFLIYEEMRKYLVIYSMRRPLVIYDFATAPFWIPYI
jgi:hypothetical protein